MYTKQFLAAVGGVALANAQAPPPVSTLSTTMSGVLPVLPSQTPFLGVGTIEGAIIYDGPMNPGFTGPGGNATIQSSLPQATYTATLPSTEFDPLTGTTITGSITGKTNVNGTGILFSVNFANFPSEAAYGPFAYHIHNLPVPADGNCTATLSHLDPTNRGEYYPCTPSIPQSCQAGDLAGKHGNITSTAFTANYLDLYLSTVPGSPYFFGDKSIVVHATNTTRLTCANFTMVAAGSSTSSGVAGVASSTGAGNIVTATPSTTTVPFQGSAGQLAVGGSVLALAAAVVAFVL